MVDVDEGYGNDSEKSKEELDINDPTPENLLDSGLRRYERT